MKEGRKDGKKWDEEEEEEREGGGDVGGYESIQRDKEFSPVS